MWYIFSKHRMFFNFQSPSQNHGQIIFWMKKNDQNYHLFSMTQQSVCSMIIFLVNRFKENFLNRNHGWWLASNSSFFWGAFPKFNFCRRKKQALQLLSKIRFFVSWNLKVSPVWISKEFRGISSERPFFQMWKEQKVVFWRLPPLLLFKSIMQRSREGWVLGKFKDN